MTGADQPAPALEETQDQVTLATVASLLRAAEQVVIVTHRNPDGDGIGSATALASGLRRLGKEVWVVCPDPLPANLLAIPDAAAVGRSLEDRPHDLLVSVDVSDPALLMPLPAAEPGYLAVRASLNIDHHVSNLRYARYNYVDAAAAAAAEIIYEILRTLNQTIDRVLATQLLYGFVNDTHSFQNSNTTPRTLRITADLLEAGADLSGITFNLLLARSPAAARLWAATLPTLSFADHGRLAFMVVSLDALERAQADLSDADGLVEFLRAIRDVDLAVMYKQIGPRAFRLSLRTSDMVDATAIAGVFGGGGHRRAAGCDATGTLAEIQQQVLAVYLNARAESGTRA